MPGFPTIFSALLETSSVDESATQIAALAILLDVGDPLYLNIL